MLRRERRVLSLVALVAALSIAQNTQGRSAITAFAPFEVWADGFKDLRGIAVDPAGNVFVADRDAGTVTRIAPDRRRTTVARGLKGPVGLAFDLNGHLLIAEERAGRVVRVEAKGRPTAIVSDVKQPRWLAMRDDGTLYISARRLTRDTDPEPDDESAEPEVVLALGPAGTLSVFAEGLRQVQGLAVDPDGLFAATQGRRGSPRADGVIFQIPILADGTAGGPVPLGAADAFTKPIGLARDGLGALYLTTQELELHEDESKRAIAKLHPDGAVTLFGQHFAEPRGLAFDAEGNLFLADGVQVLRFRAPAAPALTLPAITTQSPLAVPGRTEPAARVDVFVDDAATPVNVTADAAGAFTASLALALNHASTLEVFATAHGAAGLTSVAAEATVTNDTLAPTLLFQAPLAGAFVRQSLGVQAQATDGSGVGTLALTLDGRALAAALTPPPPAPAVTAAATFTTTPVADGAHTLGAVATDRAGNSASVSRLVIVDNTPPDTQLTGGPPGTIGNGSATFTFTGTDILTPTPNLMFAWRLDGVTFTEFSPATTATVSGLTPGSHLFEVKARDLAGNEDPTPAQRSVAVGTLSIQITVPSANATVPAGSLLVRGTLNAGGAEVGVVVNGVPAAVQGTTFAALVPVASDTTTLAAVAATPAGITVNHRISIVVAEAQAGRLLASPPNGTAPLTVSFSLVGLPAAANIVADFDGNGTMDFVGQQLLDQTFTYMQPGVYLPTVIITDATGARTVVGAVVQVPDPVAFDQLLQARWADLKDALRRGDVDRALTFIFSRSRARYEAIFRGLAQDLPDVDSILTNIQPLEVRGGEAIYEMLRTDTGIPKSFEIRFRLDQDGIWRLWMS